MQTRVVLICVLGVLVIVGSVAGCGQGEDERTITPPQQPAAGSAQSEQPSEKAAAANGKNGTLSETELANVREFMKESAPAPKLPPGHMPIGNQSMPPSREREDVASQAGKLMYEPPETWVREPVASSMRVDQFRIPAAEGDPEDGELVVFYFGPTGAGGMEANIARWRGQFSAEDGGALPDDAFGRTVRTINGMDVTVVEATGRFSPGAMRFGAEPPPAKDDMKLLAAIVDTPNGPWYFKAVGPQKTMEGQDALFSKFLNTLSFESAGSGDSDHRADEADAGDE